MVEGSELPPNERTTSGGSRSDSKQIVAQKPCIVRDGGDDDDGDDDEDRGSSRNLEDSWFNGSDPCEASVRSGHHALGQQ
eukprot:5981047-Amphidinium_carterae.1